MQATPKIKLTIKKNRIVEEESSLTPEQESARQREQLEAKFLTAIDCLWQMELRAGDVQEDNREFLVNDIENLVKHYSDISSLATHMHETVQTDAVKQVDADSMNPHRWTRDLLSTALRANQLGNARIKAYESYHDTLVDIMKDAFPDMNSVLHPIQKQDIKPNIAAPLPQSSGESADDLSSAKPAAYSAPDSHTELGEIKEEYSRS